MGKSILGEEDEDHDHILDLEESQVHVQIPVVLLLLLVETIVAKRERAVPRHVVLHP